MKRIYKQIGFSKRFQIAVGRRLIPALVLLVMAAMAVSYTASYGPASAQGQPGDATKVEQIGSRLICQCGCNAVLINCPDQPACQSWSNMLASIKTQVAQGKDSDEIIEAFVQKYGEKVLVEPPKRGINLVAYIAPFAGLVVGALLLVGLLRGWASRGKGGGSESGRGAGGRGTTGSGAADDEYRRRVEKDLKEMP